MAEDTEGTRNQVERSGREGGWWENTAELVKYRHPDSHKLHAG